DKTLLVEEIKKGIEFLRLHGVVLNLKTFFSSTLIIDIVRRISLYLVELFLPEKFFIRIRIARIATDNPVDQVFLIGYQFINITVNCFRLFRDFRFKILF